MHMCLTLIRVTWLGALRKEAWWVYIVSSWGGISVDLSAHSCVFMYWCVCTAFCICSVISILKSQSMISISRSLLPSFVEKRPRRLRLEIEIEWHCKCNRLYSLLHLQCHSISISNLNLVGLFSTKLGKRDLEDQINNWDLRMKKWRSKCNRLYVLCGGYDW